MFIEPFKVEIWMNEWETRCTYNLAETCVASITIEELLALSGRNEGDLSELLSMKLTYGDIEGSDRLRTAISKLYANTSIADITITHGTIAANMLVHKGLVERGDHVVSIIPTYQQHYSIPRSIEADVATLSLEASDGFLPDLDRLRSMVTPETKLIAFTNPNNPTGSFMNKNKIDKLVAMLEKYPEIFILSDEIYSKIIFNETQMPSLLNYDTLIDRLIILEGWSKTFCMTGWRLGWSIWPKKLYEYANKLCVNDHSCPNSISQHAGIEALKGTKETINDIKKEFHKRKNFVHSKLNELEKISCFEPGGAFYAFPNISKSGMSAQKFADIALEEKGVALVPGTSFGDSAENFVRISYANSMENLEKAIYRLSAI